MRIKRWIRIESGELAAGKDVNFMAHDWFIKINNAELGPLARRS